MQIDKCMLFYSTTMLFASETPFEGVSVLIYVVHAVQELCADFGEVGMRFHVDSWRDLWKISGLDFPK